MSLILSLSDTAHVQQQTYPKASRMAAREYSPLSGGAFDQTIESVRKRHHKEDRDQPSSKRRALDF